MEVFYSMRIMLPFRISQFLLSYDLLAEYTNLLYLGYSNLFFQNIKTAYLTSETRKIFLPNHKDLVHKPVSMLPSMHLVSNS